jgi:DNA helicase-2/ATP-dependent DNA helicase PcrA
VPFERAGERPTVEAVSDAQALARATAQAVRELRRAGLERTAVITKTAEEAARVAAALPADLGARLLTKASPHLEPGICVLPGYLAKGLEFDAVVVHDASDARYHTDADRRLLYTACTRAMHALWLVALGRPSRLLADVPSDAYTLRA